MSFTSILCLFVECPLLKIKERLGDSLFSNTVGYCSVVILSPITLLFGLCFELFTVCPIVCCENCSILYPKYFY